MSALTVFRIREGVTDPNVILVDREQLFHSNVSIGRKRIGDLYVKRLERGRPPWLGFFDNAVDLAGIRVQTASLAAVFLIKHDAILYALVFGYGRLLLADGVLDRRFGLRATLNAVEPSRLRSIDHKRLDAVSRHTREQLSRASGIDQFGLDVDRDLLRAVTGAPLDAKYGRTLSGADQLTFGPGVPLSKLGEHLAMLSALADEKAYAVNFPWVDNVRDIQDATLESALERQLLKDLVRGKAQCWLAPPEIIDWTSTAGFAYSSRKSAAVYTDIDLEDYFAEYGRPNGLTPDRLVQDRVYHRKIEADAGVRSWSIRSCMIAEVSYRKGTYVLNEGTWYEIDRDFLNVVEDFIGKIPPSTLTLPKYADKDEQAYNARVATLLKGQFALLDRDLVRYPPRGTVEICDLFSSNRVFVHVKRSGGSATLSHLFAQGVVSAQLMVHESGFREKFLSKIPPTYRWGNAEDPIQPSDFEVCFAIVSKPGKALALPFFSKISLRTAVQNLRQLGYKVSLNAIQA